MHSHDGAFRHEGGHSGLMSSDEEQESLPASEPLELLPLLKRVSRAFYLSIRVLPSTLREPVGLAYLLARAADTIADTEALSPEERLDGLLTFREVVNSGRADFGRLDDLFSLPEHQLAASEHHLLESVPSAIRRLSHLNESDRYLVTDIVTRLTYGMEFDLTRFPPDASGQVRSLESHSELDRYTYLVAGCVGEFWTRITAAHTEALQSWDVEEMSTIGVRFGQALQMTNVLRDLPADLHSGRCYLPNQWLSEIGLTPQDLTDPRTGSAARPVLARGVEVALGHFAEAESYLAAIPQSCVRLRLAAMWPMLMGLATLDRVVRSPHWLDPNIRVKVSRLWVFRMMFTSLFVVRSNRLVSMWTRRLTRRVRFEIGRQ